MYTKFTSVTVVPLENTVAGATLSVTFAVEIDHILYLNIVKVKIK